MLIVNWKKHYYVPTLFYNETRFTSTRKGKFYFLSDFVFRIIHKYCFRYCLFDYIKFIFFSRFQKYCKYINNYFISYRSQINATKSKSLKDLNSIWIVNVLNKHRFLSHFYFITMLYLILKTKFEKLVIKFYIYLKEYLKFNFLELKKKIILYLILKLKIIFFYKNATLSIFKSNNLMFLLYQLKIVRNIFNYSYNYFLTQKILNSILNKYFINFLYQSQNKYLSNLKQKFDLLNKNFIFNLEKLKLKCFFFNFDTKLNIFWKRNYFTYYNYILNNYHNIYYYSLLLKRIDTFNSLKKFNSMTLNNLILKKELYFKYKKLFSFFFNKFTRFKRFYDIFFNDFLNYILYEKKNWLLGKSHKFKFFNYLVLMFHKIQSSFKKIYLLNRPLTKSKKLSFFFNSTKIRENFFYYLGKKKYSEEFILLKNKKWYFKFYLKQYYNVSFKFIMLFYYEIRKKFKVKTIKELFLFLEYNISIFCNKYIIFSFNSLFDNNINFSNLYLNNFNINLNVKTLFYIGDVIEFKSLGLKFKYYYDKFFIFFNIIYYINPFYFNSKFDIIYNIYFKLFKHIHISIGNILFNFKSVNNFNINTSYLNYFKNKLKNIVPNLKLMLKSLILFNSKYNLVIRKQNKFEQVQYIKAVSRKINIKSFLSIYSFGKTYKKYKLIQFKQVNTNLKKKKFIKPFFLIQRLIKTTRLFHTKNTKLLKATKRVKTNNPIPMFYSNRFYKFLFYKWNPSNTNSNNIVYNRNFFLKLNKNYYSIWLLKKFFFLKRKNKFFNLFYNFNF